MFPSPSQDSQELHEQFPNRLANLHLKIYHSLTSGFSSFYLTSRQSIVHLMPKLPFLSNRYCPQTPQYEVNTTTIPSNTIKFVICFKLAVSYLQVG